VQIARCTRFPRFDTGLSGEAGKEILVPYPADEMTVWPISPRVNNPKNNDAGILEPVAADAQARRPDA
jgi:putative SOS response-associated peptidase YedK